MIDLRELQKNFESVSSNLQRRGLDKDLIKNLREISEILKSKKQELETHQAEQNKNSKLFGDYLREKKDVNELKVKVAQSKDEIVRLTEELRITEDELFKIALNIPNLIDEDVPDGVDEDGNIEIKKVLEPKSFDFTPKEHWELSQDWIDFERGVKLSKSRFSVLINDASKIYRALINYMLDFNASRGFKEVTLPYLANEETLLGTGQLPKFKDDLFKIEDEGLYLIPTSEVALVNLFRDEILSKDELPLKLTSYTECFRKEAGSAGRDVRGMIRQHQFGKVELVSITTPQDSDRVFEEMLSCASDLLASLDLPHRLMKLCAGDIGFGAAKTIDLEVWFAGQNRYREISSVSNTRDFQARRAKIRFKDDKKNTLVHTLNGSSLAVGRTLIAIMENYQKADGSIEIPTVLKKYLS